jgi:hypothetical protein
MKFVVMALVAGLLVAHQDYWNWNDSRLVMGFLPVGLAYHLGISLAAAAVWIFAVTWAWPGSFYLPEAESGQLPSSSGNQPFSGEVHS